MIARTVVKEHAVAFVKSLEADPVFLVHLLLLERYVVPFAVPGAEPLRDVGVDNTVLVPHPEAEVLHRCQSSLVVRVFYLKLVVDLGEEDRVRVETVEIPPRAIVLRRCPEVLHHHKLSQVAQEVIDDWAVPLIALLVDAHPVVRRAKREQSVDFQVRTSFDDSPRDQATLGNANDVDLLAGEVRVVVQLVANSRGLPIHALEDRSGRAVADFNAFHDSLVVDLRPDHVNPVLQWARVVDAV